MGEIIRIAGPLVVASGMLGSSMNDVVKVGAKGLIGEIIQLKGDNAVIQVYEETGGVRPGEKVESQGVPLSVELGPGLLSQVYDGVQRPLDVIKAKTGAFIGRGVTAAALDRKKKWHFHATAKKGAHVKEGDVIGYVEETPLIKHRIMIPYGVSGKLESIKDGSFTVDDTVATVGARKGSVKVTMAQKRPVRSAAKYAEKIAAEVPLITGQRVIDTFFPIAKGGTAATPGPFGAGKCVTGDTKMLVDGRLEEIEALFAREGKTEALSDYETVKTLAVPIEIHTFDGRSIVRQHVNQVYKGRTDSIVEVRTRSGRRVRLTPAHKLFALDEDLNIVEREAGQLSAGDFIIAPRKIEHGNAYQEIRAYSDCRVADTDAIAAMTAAIDDYRSAHSLSLKQVAGLLGVNYDAFMNYYTCRNAPGIGFVRSVQDLTGRSMDVKYVKSERHSKPVRVVTHLTEDFAELLGLLMSDGTIRGKRTVIFFNNDAALLGRAKTLLQKLFGLEAREKWQRTVNSVEVNSTALASLLFSLGFPARRKSRNVELPAGLLASPDSVLERFLKAYVSGDGSMGKRELEIATASEKMRSGLCYLLLRLGMLYRTSERKEKGHTYYRIFISPREAAKIYPEYRKERYFNSSDIVPMNSALFRRILGGTKPYAHEKRHIATAGYYVDQNFTAQVFQKMVSVIGDSQLSGFAEALDSIFCDEIAEVDVSHDVTDVYDLVVPGTHNFVGGNIPMVLHNTVTQQQLARHSDADIVVYVGCGERGNEMTDVLTEFPELKDPKTGRPLMERTVLIANTSNMPVAAREASIYTGITIAEYFRDMGYDVAMMADSTSRWAEAMREISARLEEMPGEESYPAYLPKRLAEFYERAGRVKTLNGDIGSVTLVGAVSPPGGDTSEPVSQGTMRVVKVFWSLDDKLAGSRHFPAINWLLSYSLYLDTLEKWYDEHIGEEFAEGRSDAMLLLQREAELKDIVQLVGADALPDAERVTLEIGRMLREDFLRQIAFDEIDTYSSLNKQMIMLKTILHFRDKALSALEKEVDADAITKAKVRGRIARMKGVREAEIEKEAKSIMAEINSEFDAMIKGEKVSK